MSTVVNDQIDKLQAAFQREVERVRSFRYLTDEAKRARIAAAYVDGTQKMRALQEQDAARQATRRRSLESRVYGISTLTGDTASLAISRRDAGDRVARLKTEDEALALLTRAERSGDEPLARALAERATEMDWIRVGNAFLETRPHLDADLNELWHMRTPALREVLHSAMTDQLIRVPEIAGMNDTDLHRVAADATAQAV
jgi:hypothetical protein